MAGILSSASLVSREVYKSVFPPHRSSLGGWDRFLFRFRLLDTDILRMKRRNTNLIAKAEKAAENFKQARGFLKKAKENPTAYDQARVEELEKQFQVLKNTSFELSRKVLDVAKLVQVDPGNLKHQALFKQMVLNEKVHQIGNGKKMTGANKRELMRKRLGLEGMDKDSQALVVETENGLKLLSQIFRYHASVPVKDGMIDVRDIPGNVVEIKSNDCRQVDAKVSLTGYWTITSIWPKAGEELISRLPTNNFETTISPVRGFTKFREDINRDEILAMSDDEIRHDVLQYLMSKNDDGAFNFHMKNGASIGWIQINRDVPPSSDEWITVNYFYDRSTVEQNAKAFKNGETIISRPLEHYREKRDVNHAGNDNFLVPVPDYLKRAA